MYLSVNLIQFSAVLIIKTYIIIGLEVSDKLVPVPIGARKRISRWNSPLFASAFTAIVDGSVGSRQRELHGNVDK